MHLRINREQAITKISLQIQKGKEIFTRIIEKDNDLDELIKLTNAWSSQCWDILDLIFSDGTYATRFDTTAPRNNQIGNFLLEVKYYKETIAVKVLFLESLVETIDLIPEEVTLIKKQNNNIQNVNHKVVFVVHGRNSLARKAMFQFLRSLHLQPLEWSQAVEKTSKASPYVGEILDTAFSIAQAAIILFTPDDEAQLKEEFRGEKEPAYETELTGQARPNVIFEAGMAMGMYPDRTILVEFGDLRPISDITGRHVIRMNNSISRRQELAQRLKTAGCDVNLSGTDWHDDGDFESAIKKKV